MKNSELELKQYLVISVIMNVVMALMLILR